MAPFNKLAMDVLTVSRHWHPKWVIHKVHRTKKAWLVPRTAVSAEACDAAIDQGEAKPIPREKQAICDAMDHLKVGEVHSVHHIHCKLLEMHTCDSRGWFIFLEATTEKVASNHIKFDLGGDLEDPHVQHFILFVMEHWRNFCKLQLCKREGVCGNGGVVFCQCVRGYEKFVIENVDLHWITDE